MTCGTVLPPRCNCCTAQVPSTLALTPPCSLAACTAPALPSQTCLLLPCLTPFTLRPVQVPYTLALTPPSNQPAPPLLFLLLSPTSTLPLPSLGEPLLPHPLTCHLIM